MNGLGLGLACSARSVVGLARAAEDAGFTSAWATEFSGRSGTAPLAAMAVTTTRIGLGSAIIWGFGRSPLVLAGEARDIDELSDGRLLLGLGSAQPTRMRDWLGIEPTRPAERMEELIRVLRSLWHLHEVDVHHDGPCYRAHVPRARHLAEPVRAEIPIHLAAVNSRMVHVAGTVADGLIVHPLVDEHAFDALIRPRLFDSAGATDRPSPPRTTAMLITVADDDAARARRRAARQIAFYAQHSTYTPLLRSAGFDEEAGSIRAAARTGSDEAMVDAVSSTMIDEIAAAGPPDKVRDHVSAIRGHYDDLILHVPSTLLLEPEGERTYVDHARALIEIFGQ